MKSNVIIVLGGALLFAIATALGMAFYVVSPGHVGVSVVGGKITGQVDAGWGFINPLADMREFDCRQKTMDFPSIALRSQDQLETLFDISVQYNAIRSMASTMTKETGDLESVVDIHLVPKFRSVARDAGRGVLDSKEFFTEAIQQSMTDVMLTAMTEFMAPKGIEVTAVLIRAIDPPQFIEEAVQRREEREQETERQKAELARFEIEQEQRVVSAQAEFDAAELQAKKILVLATADADAVKLMGKAITQNPLVLRMEYFKTWNGTLPTTLLGGNDMDMNLLMPVGGK